MAKVKIQGHASGTGILTVTAPNTSTDRTITLPDATGTLLNSDGDGSSLTGVRDTTGGRRNMIINGAMQVSQRGTSFAAITSGDYSLDRWMLVHNLGAYTVTQNSTGADGFANSFKVDCTTADASPAATEYLSIRYQLEGQDLQGWKKGTASAESVTLSFWVKCNKTGNMQVNLLDLDNTRIIGNTVTINVADTWEQKSLTFAGDTTGAFGDDNASSLMVEFFLDAGSNYTSGAVPTSWEAKVDTDRNAGGTLDLADSTSNYLNITGVQLELGSTATAFEHRSYGEELALCQRYCQKWGVGRTYASIASGGTGNATDTTMILQFPVVMRTSPTIVIETIGDWIVASDAGYSFTTILNYLATWGGTLNTQGSSGMTTGTACILRVNTSDSPIFFTAEL